MGRVKVPSAKVETITPKMAERLLKMDKKNRKKHGLNVQKFARDMKQGKFVLTSVGIGIDTNNILTNGGHRLTACIKSNVPFEAVLVKNLSPDARNYVDGGKGRSFSDSLVMNDLCSKRGKDDEVLAKGNYTKMIASCVSYIILHQTGKFDKLGSASGLINNQEVVEFVTDNEAELIKSAKFITEQTKGLAHIQKPTLMFVYQMHKLYGADDRIQDFVKIVCGNGASSNPLTCPAHLLGKRLIANHNKANGKLRTQHLVGLYVDASNKYMRNLAVKSIRTKSSQAQVNTIQPVGNITTDVKDFFNAVNQNLHTA